MLWLYIILGILLLILILLLLPITVKLHYRNELSVVLYIGFVKLRLLPSKPKKSKKKKKQKQKKTDDKTEKNEDKKKNIISEKGLSWLAETIKKIAELAQNVLKSFFKHIIIKNMMISVSVAEGDAAATAIHYGYYCSAIYPAAGIIARSTNCKKYGVDITPDFNEKAKSCYTIDFEAKILVIWILAVLLKNGRKIIDTIKNFI